MLDWPFEATPDTEVIVLERILFGNAPLRLVARDPDAGMWQFLDGEDVTESDAVIAELGDLIDFDPSLEQLAVMPSGVHAWRETTDAPWQIRVGDPDE